MTRIATFFVRNFTTGTMTLLLTGILCGAMLGSPLQAQSAPRVTKTAVAGSPTRYQPDRFAGKAKRYYASVWGVDSLSVKSAESGELIRFSYRILDPQKARIFNDKKIGAYLNSPEHRIQLVIPSLEKVGQLRQINKPEAGKSYWMAFSNPHKTVTRGDRVNVVIGNFHADGLIVE